MGKEDWNEVRENWGERRGGQAGKDGVEAAAKGDFRRHGRGDGGNEEGYEEGVVEVGRGECALERGHTLGIGEEEYMPSGNGSLEGRRGCTCEAPNGPFYGLASACS